MLKLVDKLDSKSSAERRAGSNPASPASKNCECSVKICGGS